MVRGRTLDYRQRLPGAADVALVIEVADTTLAIDRGRKLAVYAAAGIPEYWLVDLIGNRVEVYRDPQPAVAAQPARYASLKTLKPGDKLPLVLDGKEAGEIAIADFLV